MSKDWLIRTKTNQILGPVSHQKMCDLVRKKMLSEEDEIAAGNGYWFWIKEKDLLDKYLFGETPQPFNPIERAEKESSDNSDPLSSDTGDIESAGEANLSRIASTKENIALKENIQEQETSLLHVETSTVSEEEQTLSRFPAPEDLEYPDEPEEIKKEELDLDMTVEIKAEQLTSSLSTKNEGEKEYEEEEDYENEENDKSSSTKRSFWMRIVLFIILLLASVLYYYTGILKRPLTDLPFLNIIFPSADAQEFDSLKKNYFLPDWKDSF